MEKNKILTADVLDIIFEGKNKEYGAYQLRKAYKKTLGKALVITGTALLLALGGTVLAGIIKDHSKRGPIDTVDTVMAQLDTENPTPPPPPPPPPKPEQPKLDVKQILFTPPVIVDDTEVKPDEIIREIEPDVAISNKTQDGDDKQIVQAPVEDDDTKVLEIKKPDEENTIFTSVQIEASFPTGEEGWRDFLRKTLNAETPVDNGATAGKYTVIVKFVVSKDGSLSNITCENDPGFGMCEEAVRVINKTRNWKPAINNGKNVNAYRRQPITFVVED